ncbi:MAG: hypothetical protein JWL62_3019 [Hyphomicrobiales bacterium]|nr:hypothetical protein [Hyphomicrobiales bacterium]
MNTAQSLPGIAIFPWGCVIEEWLDQLGLSADDFVDRMTTGWVFGYVKALQHAGWRPFIVYASEHAKVPVRRLHVGTGVPVWIVPGKRSANSRFASLHALRRWVQTPWTAFKSVIQHEGCCAILVQEYEDTRFDVLIRMGVRLGLPVFATFQGGSETLSTIERAVRARSLEKCSGLIIPSSAEKTRVEINYFGRHPPIHNIPNPLDTGVWIGRDRRAARSDLGLPQEGFIAINHGRIDFRQKATDLLLRSWTASGEDQLILIGSGHDNAKLAALIAQRRSGKVRWFSEYSTDRSFLLNCLSAANIYVSASRIEGMPVAPLEAMACGLPVVATAANGLPDILEQGEQSGGLIVPLDDEVALRSAIERMRTDPELCSRLGLAARHRIETRFGIETVSKALGTVLSKYA